MNAAKVTAVTASQLSATVIEAANEDLMLAHENYRQLLLEAEVKLKEALANYIDETKSIFSEKGRAGKSSPVYENMREAIFHVIAVSDLLSCVGLNNLSTMSPVVSEENLNFARKLMEEITPPPPPEPPAQDDVEDTGTLPLLLTSISS